MEKSVYLIGFMGSGKTTAGKKLASRLGFSFLDLDNLIENKYRISIPTIFDKYDETVFRKIEHDTLKSVLKLKNHVISTGGGTPCFYNNMDLINHSGLSFYVKLSPKSLHDRLINSKKKRPLIKNKSQEELITYIQKELFKRELYYNQAKFIIKGENLNFEELIDIISSQKSKRSTL